MRFSDKSLKRPWKTIWTFLSRFPCSHMIKNDYCDIVALCKIKIRAGPLVTSDGQSTHHRENSSWKNWKINIEEIVFSLVFLAEWSFVRLTQWNMMFHIMELTWYISKLYKCHYCRSSCFERENKRFFTLETPQFFSSSGM